MDGYMADIVTFAALNGQLFQSSAAQIDY